MDDSRFDAMARLFGRDGSRRRLLAGAMATSLAGVVAVVPGIAPDADARKKKGKKKKKRCKKAGAACSSDKQCCTSKSKRICDIPLGDSGGDKECCGGQGAACGGVDDEGNALAPFCCVGSAGVRSFVCSQNDPENPNTPGTCIPAPEE